MKKKLLLWAGVLTLAVAPLATASEIDDLTAGLTGFTENALSSLPFAASAGMDWSNAYIGQLIDTDFPFVHLGVGGTVGLTTIPAKAINPLLQAMGESPVDGVLPLPFAVANVRLGGLLLPFDVGLKFGFLPDSLGNSVPDFAFRYQNVGADIRLNLIKSDFIMPDISVGAGINVLNIGVDRLMSDVPSQIISDLTYDLNIGSPKITLDMKAVDIEVKGQVSKTFFWILTPYVGATAMIGSATAESGIGASTITTTATNLAYWSQYGINVTEKGFVKTKEAATFGIKIYGGTSLNVLFVKIDAQGMYNLTDGAVGASLGARLQL